MIVYAKDKVSFLNDVHSNRIVTEILDQFVSRLGQRPAPNEITSWRNSMQFMSNQMLSEAIPDDAGVAIEFSIPLTSKRVDFIITGIDMQDREVALIVELKQWSEVSVTDMDAVINTFLGKAFRNTAHPSYQAWTYGKLIHDYNETVREENIQIIACAYCHNLTDRNAINDSRYNEHLSKAPVFISHDAARLNEFIRKHVHYGDKRQLMYRIENGRLRPSKSLADVLSGLLRNQPEFALVDEQKIAFETAVSLATGASTDDKQVLIVKGGPGTGKSVVAINLLVECTNRQLIAQYVSRNAAPRAVYAHVLRGTKSKSEIDSLFRGSGSFTDTKSNALDVLIVDEAHRLNEKSGLYGNLGENQIKELIHAARFCVFFLDEDQRISIADIGAQNEIERWASKAGARVSEVNLPSQFRCDGSDGYLAFLNDALGIRETANSTISPSDYDFRVYGDPLQLWNEIRKLNQIRNRARLVAGYCWKWQSKSNPQTPDICFPAFGFAAQWNLASDGSLWIMGRDSVEQVGCIHTCQGLEMDYVGVIIGPDFLVRGGQIITNGLARPGQDKTVHGIRKMYKNDPENAAMLADRIIKNTYKTLMTRGMKGCFIYCTDEETGNYFRARIRADVVAKDTVLVNNKIPFEVLEDNEAVHYQNALPVYDLKIAAGQFGDDQSPAVLAWVVPPDHIRIKEGQFIAQVIGESMNRHIPNFSWCLFERNPAGSRNGKIVVVCHHDIHDADTGQKFTIKRYKSEKVQDEQGVLTNIRVHLRPESSIQTYKPIILENDALHELSVVAEFKAVLAQNQIN